MTQKLLFISIPQLVLSGYLTPTEVAYLFKVDKQTIRNWTKKGLVKAYRYGHRVFYKRHELLQSLNSTNLKAMSEILPIYHTIHHLY